MILSANKQLQINKPWFKVWFDSTHYQKLYAHRDESEAAGFIDKLIEYLRPSQNASMLDVGCGSGRHCKQIASKGFTVAGFDLSESSIKEARHSETTRLKFFHHDMRIPFGNSCFEYVFNFFTSFGYFKTYAENNSVIRNMSQALTSNGTLVIDYLNVAYSASRLRRSESKEIDGLMYKITRWMDDDFFYKKIELSGQSPEASFAYTEQVAKFTLNDFNEFFLLNNLKLVNVFGDYNLGSYDFNHSPRMIMIVKKGT